MSGRGLAAVAVFLLVLSGCAEDVEVSRDEAIEVLILDGLSRERATCIVNGVEGVVDFAKVTGVDPEITENELADLASVSGSCTTPIDDGTTVVDANSPEAQLDIAEGGGIASEIEARIETLVTGGLDPVVAECVGSAIAATDDPLAALSNGNFITEAISVCSR